MLFTFRAHGDLQFFVEQAREMPGQFADLAEFQTELGQVTLHEGHGFAGDDGILEDVASFLRTGDDHKILLDHGIARVGFGELGLADCYLILAAKTFGQVQAILKQNYRQRANQTRRRTPAMLKGIIRCGNCGGAMRPTYSRKGDRQYRYYQCVKSTKLQVDHCPVRSVAAGIAEYAVVGQLRAVLSRPEIIAPAARAAQEDAPDITEREVADGKLSKEQLTIFFNKRVTD